MGRFLHLSFTWKKSPSTPNTPPGKNGGTKCAIGYVKCKRCCVMSERKRPLNGKFVSTLTAKRSKHDFRFPSSELEQLLRTVYDRFQKLTDSKKNAKARDDFVFHMTDWIKDFEDLAAVYACPQDFDAKTGGDIVYSFLIHALGHLMAAGRILMDELCDPFATEASGVTSKERKQRSPMRRTATVKH
jgi:hypothetical protein